MNLLFHESCLAMGFPWRLLVPCPSLECIIAGTECDKGLVFNSQMRNLPTKYSYYQIDQIRRY